MVPDTEKSPLFERTMLFSPIVGAPPPPIPIRHSPKDPKLAILVPLLPDTGRENKSWRVGRASKGKVIHCSTPARPPSLVLTYSEGWWCQPGNIRLVMCPKLHTSVQIASYFKSISAQSTFTLRGLKFEVYYSPKKGSKFECGARDTLGERHIGDTAEVA